MLLRVTAQILCGLLLGVGLITFGAGWMASAAGPDGKKAAPAAAKAAPQAKKTVVKKAAPAFTLKDADGKTVSLADYKGKVVLLNFWATWCGPCKIEIPWFIEFENKYKGQGFAVLGVAMDDEGWEVVKPYLSKNKITYRILGGNDQLATAYGGVESLPTTFIIAKDGTIFSEHVGLVSKDDYEKEIRALLDKKADAGASSGVVVARSNHP